MSTHHKQNEQEKLRLFQTLLLEIISQDISPQEMQKKIQQQMNFSPYQEYCETFELKMIEIASIIYKKWL